MSPPDFQYIFQAMSPLADIHYLHIGHQGYVDPWPQEESGGGWVSALVPGLQTEL